MWGLTKFHTNKSNFLRKVYATDKQRDRWTCEKLSDYQEKYLLCEKKQRITDMSPKVVDWEFRNKLAAMRKLIKGKRLLKTSMQLAKILANEGNVNTFWKRGPGSVRRCIFSTTRETMNWSEFDHPATKPHEWFRGR